MRRSIVVTAILIIGGLTLMACGTAGPQGPEGPAGPQGEIGPAGPVAEAADLSCTDCHNDTSSITGIQLAWSESGHGTGESYLRGASTSCAGCHSGGAFSARIADGLAPDEVEAGDPHPTRQDCSTCHQVHTTYTGEDFALETIAPVSLYAFEGQTFDGGEGNLCVNCHQPRRQIGEAVDGIIEVDSTHWGPHHGPQSAMLLGLGGAGDVVGSPSRHAVAVENTCVDCHMGENSLHTFEPNVAACLECHDGAEDFDINGVQSDVQALLDELEEKLIARGLLDEEGHPAVASVPEEYAAALWNWIYIAHEDNSLGVHNPAYTIDLLEASLAVFE